MQQLYSFSDRQQLDRAVLELYHRNPYECAFTVVTRRQIVVSIGIFLLLVSGLFLAYTPTLKGLVWLCNIGFFVNISFSLLIALTGLLRGSPVVTSSQEVARLTDSELPNYTVLVPLYNEAGTVAALLDHLRALQYPAEKLQILLLLEEDDPETLKAALAAQPAGNVSLVAVPRSYPKTKPKACNVGLFLARGEYLTIYDAEDSPEIDQLKKAVIAFRQGPPNLFCVQAKLSFVSSSPDNFLTRMFTLEYLRWFNFMLVGFSRLHLPTPLGGTSTHFRTATLRELGGWDPFNVTEDLDLGIRAAAHGYAVQVMDSVTYEEVNRYLWNWIRQRSRWIKGYMQTALVRLRTPAALIHHMGWISTISAVILLTGTVSSHLLGPVWLFNLLLLYLSPVEVSFSPLVLYFALFNVVVGYSLVVFLNLAALVQNRKYKYIPFAFLDPLYWVLHTLAAYKALWQLFTNPSFWEKTTHDQSTVSQNPHR